MENFHDINRVQICHLKEVNIADLGRFLIILCHMGRYVICFVACNLVFLFILCRLMIVTQYFWNLSFNLCHHWLGWGDLFLFFFNIWARRKGCIVSVITFFELRWIETRPWNGWRDLSEIGGDFLGRALQMRIKWIPLDQVQHSLSKIIEN